MSTSFQTPVPLHDSPQARPWNQQQRTSYMRATAALNQMLLAAPTLPYSATVTAASFAPASPTIRLHMSSVEDVEEFGRFFDGYVTSTLNSQEPLASVKTTAVGEFRSVPFEAWVLTAPAVAA